MAATEQLFIELLRSDNIKDNLCTRLSTPDLCNIRQTSSACCNLLTKRLFKRIKVSFTPQTFTKPSKVTALGRIGHHVEHLSFYLPHSDATFLPPLVHPETGKEISFLYTPHTSMTSVLTRPKYGNMELGEILTQQYPPLFHAATNVPSFINAMKMVPNLRHLSIRCPGQDPRERYRRDVVDYALISLRIAVERAPLVKLNKLSLSSLHPSAFNYLKHVHGFGNVPSAGRRWGQIKKLYISVESWDFYGSSPGLDHLKMMDDYIRFFAPALDKFSFTWLGQRGPCPVALSADPLFSPPQTSQKLFHEVTSPMSPLPLRPPRSAIRFLKLRYLQIRNTTMNAPQLKELIKSHNQTVKEFDFDNVVLLNNGSWEEALASVDRDDTWSRSSLATASEYSFVTSESSEELPSPSAAVEAASKELLESELGGFGLSDEEKTLIEGLSEDIAAAREASMSFTTNLKKKRVRRRHRKYHSSDVDHDRVGTPERSPSTRSRRRKPSLQRSETAPEAETIPIVPPLKLRHEISAPILAQSPQPVLLQPTVYDPATKHVSAAQDPDEGISSVQRNIEQEEAHRLLAEDATARTSALERAKAAVLAKLSREYRSLSHAGNKGSSSKKGRVGVAADAAAAACRLMTGRELLSGCAADVVLDDRRTLDSQSVLVPLMFSRS